MLLSLAAIGLIVALLADGGYTLLARRRREAAARPWSLIVTARAEHPGHLVRLTLADPRGRRLPAFRAGQHLGLQVPAGANGETLQRAYSLAAWKPSPRAYELGIKREEKGAVSRWVWDQLTVGTQVVVYPPKGDFALDIRWRQPLVLIAGGIGITPMRAMLHARLTADTANPVFLFHAARSAGELLYREEFEWLAQGHPAIQYRPSVSQPDPVWPLPCRRIDADHITRSLAAAGASPGEALFYLCASLPMMESLREGLTGAGIAPGQVRWEAFGVDAGGIGGQRLRVVRDGRTTDVVTSGEPTLMATLEAHRLAPASNCRAGTCGECRMRLLAGEVRCLVSPGVALAEDEFLPCICAARGDLIVAHC